MEGDGFIIVSRRGRKKSNKQTKTTIIKQFNKPSDNQRVEIDIPNEIIKIQSAVTEVENSDLFTALVNALTSTSVSSIHCYGLGHVGCCVTARYQLALLLCLRRFLHISDNNVSVFDPVFFPEEKEILSRLSLRVTSENTECKDRVSEKTLFFLPHCPKQMTNNLLWSNWNPDRLPDCLLLANSLSSIIERTPAKTLEKEVKFVSAAMEAGLVTETKLPNSFKYSDVFNDTSLHSFALPEEKLPDLFWDIPEPVYSESDAEFIRKKH